MSREVLERAFEVVFSSGLVGDSLGVVWHAGEPLVVKREFYENADEILRPYESRCRITRSVQTNATLINDEWCDYFKRANVRVGVSIDGPASLNDRHRIDRSRRGTHARIMNGIDALQRNGVDFHVIAVITGDALDKASEVYQFFVDSGIRRVGFNFEETEGAHTHSSLEGSIGVGTFLREIFELNNTVSPALDIREFNGAYNILTGGDKESLIPRITNDQARPFGIICVDVNGSLSTFSPELLGLTHPHYGVFSFGNVMTDDLVDVLENPRFLTVARDIVRGVAECERTCQYFAFCGGGAPANKLFENGSFNTTETMYCRNAIQAPLDIVLRDLELRLGLSPVTTARERC